VQLRQALGVLLVAALVCLPAAAAEDGFAPVGLEADLAAARCLASRAELEQAIELLESSLAQHAEDPGAALAGRDLELLRGALELRESQLAKLASEGGKLRVVVDGKRRNLRVASYTEGLVSFALNKYRIDELDVSAISLRDLASSWKSAKAGKPGVRAYALRLAGDKSWKSQWPKDEAGHERLVEDLTQLPDSIERGVRVLTLRELENYVGRELGRSEGRVVLALTRRLFDGAPPKLEGDDGTRLFRLRALVRKSLVAAWGLEELASGLHATEFQVIGNEIRLVYDFAEEDELLDWPGDETHLLYLERLGTIRTPRKEWHRELEKGFLQVLGVHNLRHVVPFHGPLHLRYPLQVAKPGEPGGMWMCGTFLHDDLDRSYLSVFGMGHLLLGFERGRPKQTKRDQISYFAGKNYFIDVTYDSTGLLTVKREDKPEASLLTLKTRKVNHGNLAIGVSTDYLTRYDSFEIQGQPDLSQMDLYRDLWVIDQLEDLGF